MPLPALFLPFLAAAAQAAPADPIVVTGHSGVSFISPMGEPFRARTATDDALARWFGQADRNRDGVLTADEMQADADRFFATLDTTPDARILPEELVQYEWEVAPEIQVNARLRRPRSASAGEPEQPRRGGHGRREQPYDPHGLQGAARYALLNIPEPVAAADADLDRAVTLDEFRRAAQARFQLLDGQRQGKLTLAGLKALLPKLPPPGNKAKKRRTDEADTRIGVPLPAGD